MAGLHKWNDGMQRGGEVCLIGKKQDLQSMCTSAYLSAYYHK